MLTVIVFHGPSENPAKRELETFLVGELAQDPNVRLLGMPHLYDLTESSPEVARLREPAGDLVVLSWLYDRAARWVLQARGVSAQGRTVHYFDFKTHSDGPLLLQAVRRIAQEHSSGAAAVAEGARTADRAGASSSPPERAAVSGQPPTRRWYPVIDYDRCTHCMECIDFCLFGVYGVDEADRILVEQPDQCRKGCPACSRVCPENAIMFPQHKTPAIAGAEGSVAALKLDLSSLFRDSHAAEDPHQVAAAERQAHLPSAGPGSVRADGRYSDCSSAGDLDRLLDALDDFDQ